MKFKKVLSQFALAVSGAILAACASVQDSPTVKEGPTAQTGSTCTLESLPQLPDVRISSVTTEPEPAPHCKVAGVIGTETNFELLLPDDWNGKFVMGGGGGFVGSVVNTSLTSSFLMTLIV